jgi:DNA-directed RNA polymerase subunit RPC12/RpoP
MPELKELVDKYSKFKEWGKTAILEYIPPKERKYKCHTCHQIVELEGEDLVCPACGGKLLEIMCPLDHCHCGHDIVSGIAYCPMCGRPMCPEDGCHDVVQISRVTGLEMKICSYFHRNLSDVAGWNEAKKSELKDRHRYDVAVLGV